MTVPAVGLSDILLRLTGYRRLIVGLPLLCALVAGTVAFFSLPRFTAFAKLLPPQTNTATASTLLNQVGGSAALGASALTLKNPSELYASLFMSRSIQDEVTKRFNLAESYEEADKDRLREIVAHRTRVDVGRDGIITLAYTDKTSQGSADIANGMIDAMYQIAQRLARDEAERRTKFYERLIEDAKEKLIQADRKLMEKEQETGLTRLKGQEEASVAATSELRGLIATRHVDLEKMLATATPRHPQIIRMQAELRGLQTQLQTIESDGRGRQGPASEAKVGANGEMFLPFGDYAKKRMLIEPLRREVDISNNVMDQLVKARALSQVDESRDLSVIQVLDIALPPTRRSGPRPLLNAAVGGVIGFLVAVGGALVWDLLFTSIERRRRWLAVIRAIGTRKTCLDVVAVQDDLASVHRDRDTSSRPAGPT